MRPFGCAGPSHSPGRIIDMPTYRPYTDYGRSIFAIAGNHDGKVDAQTLTLSDAFVLNMDTHRVYA